MIDARHQWLMDQVQACVPYFVAATDRDGELQEFVFSIPIASDDSVVPFRRLGETSDRNINVYADMRSKDSLIDLRTKKGEVIPQEDGLLSDLVAEIAARVITAAQLSLRDRRKFLDYIGQKRLLL